MPLDTTSLQNALEHAFLNNLPSPSNAQRQEIHELCASITEALLIFVESATITYTAGLVAPPGGGPVTGIFSNIIS